MTTPASVAPSTSGAPLSRQAAMQQLLAGIAEDQAGYNAMLGLLEEQFIAALRHQSARLGELAELISAAVDVLEARRSRRVALAKSLLGPTPTMAQVFALLKPEPRARQERDWQALEQTVQECKRIGKRNSDLLLEQYSIMQRVLHGEDQTYEPA